MESRSQVYEEDSATVVANTKFPSSVIQLPAGTTEVVIRFTPYGNDMTFRMVETDGTTDHETQLRYHPLSAAVPNGCGAQWRVAIKNTTSRKLQFRTDAAGQVNMVVQAIQGP